MKGNKKINLRSLEKSYVKYNNKTRKRHINRYELITKKSTRNLSPEKIHITLVAIVCQAFILVKY